MLRLLKPFLRGVETPGRYPESLVKRALDRAVEGTDPRLSLVRGFQKKLRPPVVHAIDHIVDLIDHFPEPLETSASSYGNSPVLRSMFSSPARMLEVLGSDVSLIQFLRENKMRSGNIRALLLAEQTTRDVLGSEIQGDIIRRDIAQRVVSFDQHRLIGIASSSEQARSEMGSRAYNHLLALALEKITEVKEERDSLSRQRTLLQRKLRTLDRGGWSFEGTRQSNFVEPDTLEKELGEIETKLKTLGTSDRTLARHLELTCELLGSAEKNLWKEELVLYLDKLNVERNAQDSSARQLKFQVLGNSRGERLVMLPVLIPLQALPETGDIFSEAKKYL